MAIKGKRREIEEWGLCLTKVQLLFALCTGGIFNLRLSMHGYVCTMYYICPKGTTAATTKTSSSSKWFCSSNNLKTPTQPHLTSSICLSLSLPALSFASWKCKWKWEWKTFVFPVVVAGSWLELWQMFWHHTTVTYKSIWHATMWNNNMQHATVPACLPASCCHCHCLCEIFPCAAMYNRPKKGRGGESGREGDRESQERG